MTLRGTIKHFLYGRVPGLAGSFPYYGTKVYFPRGSVIFRLACEQGIYEESTVRILTLLWRPSTTYIDVGANIGLTSVPLLATHPTCSVVSFEPSPVASASLLRTANGSRFGARWTVIAKAAADRPGIESFSEPKAGMDAFAGFVDTQRVAVESEKLSVPVTTIDAELEKLGNPDVSIIKIDVEGAELRVLSGAEVCIERCKPQIVMEWNRTNLSAHQCDPTLLFSFAQKHLYRLYSLPHLSFIPDSRALSLQTLVTETFLLSPLAMEAR